MYRVCIRSIRELDMWIDNEQNYMFTGDGSVFASQPVDIATCLRYHTICCCNFGLPHHNLFTAVTTCLPLSQQPVYCCHNNLFTIITTCLPLTFVWALGLGLGTGTGTWYHNLLTVVSQLDDVEETLVERLLGLKEMLPDRVWSVAGKGLWFSVWLFRRSLWVVGTSLALLALPPFIEQQRIEYEEMQKMQKKQVRKGGGKDGEGGR